MTLSKDQIAFVTDVLSGLGPVSVRRMFGGAALYFEGTIFAIVMADGALRLKGAGDMRAAFEAAGWQGWTYTGKSGKSSTMPYWTMPDALMDDPDAACAWARRALDALRPRA